MKKQNLKIEKATKQIVKHIADQEVYGWPPLCPALCYQPVRPKMESDHCGCHCGSGEMNNYFNDSNADSVANGHYQDE